MTSASRISSPIQPNKITYTYNTLIRSHLSNSNSTPKTAFQIYVKMKRNGINCDNYTYPFVLKACKMMVYGLWEGRQVHGEVVKVGFSDSDLYVRNGLIGLYCKFRQINCSRFLFDEFDMKDLVSWNLMLSGYVESGDMVEARKLFDEMPERDVVSWSIMIDGYGKKCDVINGRSLFDQMHKRDLVSWNTMISSYAKVGDMMAARELFDAMEHKNVISWSIMIDGYLQHRNPNKALNFFNTLLSRNVKPDKFCVVGAISACAQLGALDQGRWIHAYIKKNKIDLDIVVNTALVDMYMKCGSTKEARVVFGSMLERNVVSWNAMVSGLGMNGFGDEALCCFNQMEKEGIRPDDLIYVSVLSACSHAGFVIEGLEIFRKIQKPKVEHYGCVVDLLVRAGKFDQALNFIASMPMEPNLDLLGSVLLACRVQKNTRIGEFALNKLKELNADDCGVYVLMSNIYADNGMWEGVTKMRKNVVEKGMVKENGKSVIEAVDGGVEEFICGETGRVQGKDIEQVIWSLSKMRDLE